MTGWHRAWLRTLEERCSLLWASVPLLHFLLNIRLSPFTSISLAVGFFFTHSSGLIHITELALWVKELGTFSLQDVSSLFPCLKFSSSPLSSPIFQYYKKPPQEPAWLFLQIWVVASVFLEASKRSYVSFHSQGIEKLMINSTSIFCSFFLWFMPLYSYLNYSYYWLVL